MVKDKYRDSPITEEFSFNILISPFVYSGRSSFRQVIMEGREHWVFYLKLSPKLPENYIRLASEFQHVNKKLIPVGVKTLLECIRNSHKVDLVVIVKSLEDLKCFNRHIKKVLKILMRTGRIQLFMVSSFQSVNDPQIMRKGSYEFAKLPVSIEGFTKVVSKKIELRKLKANKWPGGVRGRFQAAG